MGNGFIHCEKCGKRLIKRLPNGLLKFVFGKGDDGEAPVELLIHGSVRVKCLRRPCRHPNIINFFPNPAFNQPEAEANTDNKTPK